MKNFVLSFVSIMLMVGHGAMAQMLVTTGQTAQQLANIIAGPGVVVSNASITGSATAIGAFTTGANPIGANVPSGVVFGTGTVTDFAQNQTTFSSAVTGSPGIPYLANLAGITSYDGLILEFDFVPNADWVSFDYVFGSEEHPGFSCNPTFNDIFAITVQGVSVPLAETLITLVPGTGTPVSIGTVNNLGCGNPTYYVDNTVLNSPYVVFGGFTTVLRAEMAVICGEVYHLKMMISDGGDSSYDTGCFVAENSLTTGSVIVETATAAADSTAYEGCNNATVTLTLNGPPIAQDFDVPIWISGSTASWGIDFDPITQLNLADSTITIPNGQNTVSFTIVPINDNLSEGPEYIEFIVITSTCGLTDTFRIYINDLVPLSVVTSNDTTICIGNAICWAEADGGGGVYTYTWNNGFGVADTIFPSPAQTTVYTVSVTDNCSSTPATDQVTVTVDGGPVPFAGNDVAVCIGGSVLLNASSNFPNCAFTWNPPVNLSNPNIYNPLCTPPADSEYIVTVTRSDGCSNDDTVNVTITPPPTGDFNLAATACAGTPLIVNYTGNANAAAQYQWNFGGGIITNGSGIGPLAVYWPSPGTYQVSLTVAWNGCISPTVTNQIDVLGPPLVDAGSDISFCSGDSGPIGSAPVAGVTYAWTPINGVADPVASSTTVQITNPTHDIQTYEYILKATEQGCKSYDTINITVFPTPQAEFTIPDGECFNVNSFTLLAEGYFGTNATFAWNFGPVGFPANSNVKQPQGVIFNAPGSQPVTLVVTDNGCVGLPFVGNIDVFPMPVAQFLADAVEGCEPLRIGFANQSVGGGSALYNTWNFGDGSNSTQSNPSHVYQTGLYTVRLDVVTSEGCANSITKSSYIDVHVKPDALFSLSSQRLDILDPTVTVTNQADSILISEFTFEPFGDQITAMETDYSYLEVGTYGITQIVATEFGCLDTISGSLEVIPHYTLYIPDAFKPDDNGINEIWAPQGQSISSYNLTIYDRWNEELFYSASLDLGWNGLYKEKLVQQGTYIYKIETVDVLGEPHEYFGTFSLLR